MKKGPALRSPPRILQNLLALQFNLDSSEYGAKVRAKLGGRTEIPPPSGYQLFASGIDTFLKEHLFCDIFIRDNLDAQSRELATIGALGGMTGLSLIHI